MTLEHRLARLFDDRQANRFGTGWLSGVLGLAIGLLAAGAVLCLHFPELLTMPELRGAYPMPLVRGAIDAAIIAAMVLGALSMLLRRRKALGLAALASGLLALALGGAGVAVEGGRPAGFYLGIDWFILSLIATALIFVPLERAFALRPEQGVFREGWTTDLGWFFTSHALVQLSSALILLPATMIASRLAVPGLAAVVAALPLFVQFAAIVLVADLAQYWVHRASHAVPLLWRFHKVHHSVERMDWIAGSRLHLVDVVLTRGAVLLPLLVFGFDRRVVMAYLAFVSVHAVFIHANFAPRWRWTERMIAMPRFHHWHHAAAEEAIDRNFAVHLPIIDRWFGTHHLPGDRWPDRYGLAHEQPPRGLWAQMIWPFRR